MRFYVLKCKNINGLLIFHIQWMPVILYFREPGKKTEFVGSYTPPPSVQILK